MLCFTASFEGDLFFRTGYSRSRLIEGHQEKPASCSNPKRSFRIARTARLSYGYRMLTPEKQADLNLKHLEMVQSVVQRMSGYSASLKNFCMTITTAIVGFAFSKGASVFFWLAFLPIVVFALLDAQYLRLERRFRCLYDDLRLRDITRTPTFEINLSGAPKISYLKVIFSWSIATFYMTLAACVVIVILVFRSKYGWAQ